MMFGYDDRYGMFGGMGWGFIITIVILLLIIFLVYKMFVTNNQQQKYSRDNSALDDLNKKFVNGELSEEEYLRKKELIKK